MKDLNKLVSTVFLVAATVLTGGCRDDRKQDDHRNGYDANQPVSFITGTDANTRGTPIKDASELTSMGVFCAATGFKDWTSGAALNKMFNRYLVRNAGKWEYVGENVYWGASSFDNRYTFFGYAPNDSPGADGNSANGIKVNGAEDDAGIPTLTYTVPEDVTMQPDLMVAVPQYNRRPSGKPVELNMRHALTCVGFQVSGDGEKITAIGVKGVSQEGTLAMDGENIRWSNLSTPAAKDFSASINYDAGQNFFTAQTDMSAGLIAGNGYLMMIPQKLGQNAAITVAMDDNTVKEIPLNGSEWLAGKKTSYHIAFTPAGTITVAPGSVMLPFLNSSDKIKVFCTKNNGAPNPAARWTLASSAPWLTLSLNSDGSDAAASVSGAGTQPVYIFAERNPNSSDRTATVKLADDAAVNVTQMKYIAIPVGAGDPPANTDTYTGAFWKHSETGERLIRINVGAESNNNHGLWQVATVWYDKNWTGDDDGIVFSPDDSSDPYIYTDYPGNAENYQVKDETPFLSGEVEANGTISFRIGLQKKFSAYDETYNPARYAVLVLSYNNYEKHQRIYIRQGEGADYLMRNDDPVETGGITKRTQCVKFSPYNLTADVLDEEVPKRSGRFANFPTQAGAFFQWNNTNANKIRHAWNPFEIKMTGWLSDGYSKNAFWNTLANEHETCPYGYRRPNDGSITGYEDNTDISGSEIRQSLMLRPLTSQSTSSLDNSIWGFYADGFFDRRAKYYEKETIYVAKGTRDIAYVGRLFYNPYSNATIFFPAAGNRNYETGQLVLKNGFYWSSTAVDTEYAWTVAIYNTITVIVRGTKGYGACIRCVADE